MTEAGRVEPGWGEEVFATGGVKVTAETQGYLFAGRSSTGLYFGFQDRQHYVVTEPFAMQTGLSKPISVNDKLNALAGANDPETMDLIRATNVSGVNLAIREKKGVSVCAVGKASSLYRNYGSQTYEDAVSLIMDTWHGGKGSLHANMLGGVTAFLDAFGEQYDRDRFIRKLKETAPKDILATAKRNKADYQTLDKACATEIAKAYNKGRGSGRIESFVVV